MLRRMAFHQCNTRLGNAEIACYCPHNSLICLALNGQCPHGYNKMPIVDTLNGFGSRSCFDCNGYIHLMSR